MEKLELEENNYTDREKELLAIIGEAYLNLDTEDERYFRNKIKKALKELDELDRVDENMEESFLKFYK